jgi:hypothetical protein
VGRLPWAVGAAVAPHSMEPGTQAAKRKAISESRAGTFLVMWGRSNGILHCPAGNSSLQTMHSHATASDNWSRIDGRTSRRLIGVVRVIGRTLVLRSKGTCSQRAVPFKPLVTLQARAMRLSAKSHSDVSCAFPGEEEGSLTYLRMSAAAAAISAAARGRANSSKSNLGW